MANLSKNYLNNKFGLPGSTMAVILNGVYQPQLSDPLNSMLKKQILRIPKKTKISTPIHLLFLTTQDCHSVFEVIIAEDSYTTIIEEYASLENQPYINNIEVNIRAGARSELIHYKLQLENIEHATYQAATTIHQDVGSRVISNFISKGAKIARDNLWVKLAGKNASCNIRGMSLLRDHQCMNHNICVEHLKPQCTSNILAKGIIDEQAINNFNCRVIAHSKAVKTETHVTSKNLLLSELATANTAPELEVCVDDVICTHGATVGQLDQEALFYLSSRGIEKKLAVKILTAAFMQEITENFISYPRYKLVGSV